MVLRRTCLFLVQISGTWDNFWIGFLKSNTISNCFLCVGLAIEFIFAIIKKHEVEEGYFSNRNVSAINCSN